LLKLAASAAALPVAGRLAHAQAWPSRPLRIVIGYPAGGSTDLIARIIGNWLSLRLGQPVIIENKPGAATNLAAQTVVSAPPDGYTLLFAVASNAINASLYQNLSFNFLRDIAPVAGLAELPLVLEVNPSIPVNTIAEFVAYAKAIPAGSISLHSVLARSAISRSNCSKTRPAPIWSTCPIAAARP
jgi:tripartite-type tricarboxylate transporter receptor subunit TctC